jgi:hypothetical protein
MDGVLHGHSNSSRKAPPPAQESKKNAPEFLRGIEFQGIQSIPSTGERWDVKLQITGFDPKVGKLCGCMETLALPSKPVLTFWEGEVIDNVNNFFFTGRWNASPKVDLHYWSQFHAFSPLRPLVYHEVVSSASLSRTLRLSSRDHHHDHYLDRDARGSKVELTRALADSRWIFIRIKELYFLHTPSSSPSSPSSPASPYSPSPSSPSPPPFSHLAPSPSSSMSISGFYYCCLDRQDGTINAYYFDPESLPNQNLILSPRHRKE